MKPQTGDELSAQNRRVGYLAIAVMHLLWWSTTALLILTGWTAWYAVAAVLVGAAVGIAGGLTVLAAYGPIFARHLDRIYGKQL